PATGGAGSVRAGRLAPCGLPSSWWPWGTPLGTWGFRCAQRCSPRSSKHTTHPLPAPARGGMLGIHIDAGAHMASKKSASCGWAVFPHDAKGYAYIGDALKKAWPKLHAGDCEPYPDAKRAAALLKAAGKAAPKLDADALAAALQDAWRAFQDRKSVV